MTSLQVRDYNDNSALASHSVLIPVLIYYNILCLPLDNHIRMNEVYEKHMLRNEAELIQFVQKLPTLRSRELTMEC